MTTEEQIQQKIRALMQNIDKSIPVKWDDIYINIEMSNAGGRIYFDFRPENEERFHYSLSIPNDFKVDKHIFDQFYIQQFELSRELWKIFVDSSLPAWSSAIITYRNKKLEVSFDYTPWTESPYGPTDRRNFFKYKYINFQPRTDKEAKKFKEMEEYQKQFE